MTTFQGTMRYIEKVDESGADRPRQVTVFMEELPRNKKRKGYWEVKGALPAMMISRIIPNAWSNESATVRVRNHPLNVEHLDWVMMRYPLEIKDPEIWEACRSEVYERKAQRERLETLQRVEVSASFKGQLKDFQKEGVDFLNKTMGRALLADSMGLGKTVQSIAWLANKGEEALPAVVVAPLVTLQNWRREVIRFMQVQRQSFVDVTQMNWAEPKIVLIREGKEADLPPADIYIVNYDLLEKRKDDIVAAGPRTVIFDEIQNLSHRGTQRYAAAHEIVNCGSVKSIIGLSGTPIYNKGDEMYSICDIIYPGLLGTHEEFLKIWCDPWTHSVKPELRDAFAALLREHIMLRRRKEDVLKELPDKARYRQKVEVDIEYYEEEMEKNMQILQQKLAEANTDLRLISQAYSGFAAKERQIAGIAKLPYVAEFIENMLELGEPVVTFLHHHDVVDLLADRLARYNPVKVTGQQDEKKKNAAIDAFMRGDSNLIICGLRSGNVGINLTRGHTVVFGEFDWSPAIHQQAEDRLHRIGQKNAVFAYYLEGMGTFDEKMVETLVEKKMEINAVMGDAEKEAQAEINMEEKAREMIAMINKKLADKGTHIDITMPDKDRIRRERAEQEKLEKLRREAKSGKRYSLNMDGGDDFDDDDDFNDNDDTGDYGV